MMDIYDKVILKWCSKISIKITTFLTTRIFVLACFCYC